MKFADLSIRLKTVTEYIPNKSRVADIGSDHAYLLLYLAQNKDLAFGIAGEVNDGPFQIAQNNIQQSKFENILQARFGNGLDVIDIEDEIQCVTICGMGGILIKEILEKGLSNPAFSRIHQFVLQPNSGERELRQWLSQNCFSILHETIIEDSNKLYEILVVSKENNKQLMLSEKELMFGPFLLLRQDPLFQKKWHSELNHKKKVLSSIKQSKTFKNDKILQLSHEISMIEEVLN